MLPADETISVPPQPRLFACSDGWLCVAAQDAAQAAALGRLAGVLLALDDPSDGPAASAVATFLAPTARADALARLTAAGVPAAPCLDFDEVFSDPSSSTRAP